MTRDETEEQAEQCSVVSLRPRALEEEGDSELGPGARPHPAGPRRNEQNPPLNCIWQQTYLLFSSPFSSSLLGLYDLRSLSSWQVSSETNGWMSYVWHF